MPMLYRVYKEVQGGHMYEDINQVDLAFVMDTTGSMGPLIKAARERMIEMLRRVAAAADIHLQLGIVEYRDHEPQAKMLTSVYPFTTDLEQAQQVLMSLSADEGGDAPEAVLDGILAACHKLSWRRHAVRLLVLVGDAPPHGVGAGGDFFAGGCPCGETIASVTRQAEETSLTIHALGLTSSVDESFSEISALTGGQFFAAGQADKAIVHIEELLQKQFAELELDRQVLAQYRAQPELDSETLAQHLDVSRHVAANALVRLLSRDLIEVPVRQA
ncbi:vWA domain-containing protein [Dictyobacter halimunensis]